MLMRAGCWGSGSRAGAAVGGGRTGMLGRSREHLWETAGDEAAEIMSPRLWTEHPDDAVSLRAKEKAIKPQKTRRNLINAHDREEEASL